VGEQTDVLIRDMFSADKTSSLSPSPYHSNNSLFSSFPVPSYTPQAHFSVLLILLNASLSESGKEGGGKLVHAVGRRTRNSVAYMDVI
jgi:hypothetical protein